MNLAYTAMQLAGLAVTDDCIVLTDDDQQACALAAILGAMISPSRVVFIPSSDALPGDGASPSPGNAGRRVAALRALRAAMNDQGRPGIVCVMSGEAAAEQYAAPQAFDAAPPRLTVGDEVDPEALTQLLARQGYVADDLIDEPGEIAVRGEVIDVFPADAERPVRIEVANGRVISIRVYDPLTQRTVDDSGNPDDLETVAIGEAAEPPVARAFRFSTICGAGAWACRQRPRGVGSNLCNSRAMQPTGLRAKPLRSTTICGLRRWPTGSRSIVNPPATSHALQRRNPPSPR